LHRHFCDFPIAVRSYSDLAGGIVPVKIYYRADLFCDDQDQYSMTECIIDQISK